MEYSEFLKSPLILKKSLQQTRSSFVHKEIGTQSWSVPGPWPKMNNKIPCDRHTHRNRDILNYSASPIVKIQMEA